MKRNKEIKQGALLPPDYQARFAQALAAHQAGRLGEAEAVYKDVLRLYPDHADSLHFYGMLAHQVGRSDIGEPLMRQALGIRDDQYAWYCNFGTILKNTGKLDEAVEAFRRAIALKPDFALAHWNLALTYLVQGNFREGWREFEWRWKVAELGLADVGGIIGKPRWDGRDPAGQTLLLYGEQGAGDNIQFIRYAKILKERGAKVVVLCLPSLMRLFQTAEGIDRLIPEGDVKKEALADCNAVVSMLSVPGLCRTKFEDIPAEVPYLRAERALAETWRERLAGAQGLKIGVAWRGNPQHDNDRNRSMQAAQFAEFLKGRADVALVNLQKDATAAELAVLEQAAPLINAGAEFSDFADTAAAMVNLDLVIAVDTAVCHLAGALAVPTWTLLPFTPDWRWLMQREDSPWYPGMRLFRQEREGDWGAVIAGLRAALDGVRG